LLKRSLHIVNCPQFDSSGYNRYGAGEIWESEQNRIILSILSMYCTIKKFLTQVTKFTIAKTVWWPRRIFLSNF
jgi:hypothetical protein